MKALTLRQPWASAIAEGYKLIETRSWGGNFRGWLAIHAGKGWSVDERQFALEEAFLYLQKYPEQYPLGAIVAVGKVVDIVPVDTLGARSPSEELFGDFSPGRFAWLLDEVTAIPKPVPCSGKQGLWNLPEDVRLACHSQVFK